MYLCSFVPTFRCSSTLHESNSKVAVKATQCHFFYPKMMVSKIFIYNSLTCNTEKHTLSLRHSAPIWSDIGLSSSCLFRLDRWVLTRGCQAGNPSYIVLYQVRGECCVVVRDAIFYVTPCFKTVMSFLSVIFIVYATNTPLAKTPS